MLFRSIGEKSILHNISLNINPGETHVLMGPNGAGKSTLGYTLMGNPDYNVTGGKIIFDGEDITDFDTDKRAKKGMFLSFQDPLEVPGISLESFIRSSIQQVSAQKVKLIPFKKQLEENMDLLNMNHSYAERDLNVGFSGGEKKNSEILQLLMLEPKLALLDETDSGLDVDAVQIVSNGVAKFHNAENSCIIITHNTQILKNLAVDQAHVLLHGRIIKSGGAELVDEIAANGYSHLGDKD